MLFIFSYPVSVCSCLALHAMWTPRPERRVVLVVLFNFTSRGLLLRPSVLHLHTFFSLLLSFKVHRAYGLAPRLAKPEDSSLSTTTAANLLPFNTSCFTTSFALLPDFTQMLK